MKRLIIADVRSNSYNGISTGHYVPVAEMYKHIFEDVAKVKIAGGSIYKKYFKEEDLILLPYNVCNTSIMGKLKTLMNCRKLFKDGKNRTIVLQQSATVLSIIYIALFYHRSSKLYMILYDNQGIRNMIGNLFYKLAQNKIDGIICPNNMVAQIYKRPFCIVTDYIYTGEDESRPAISFEDKKYDLCIVGRIANGKGVIESAKKLVNTPYKMIIAGKPENELLSDELHAICDNSKNITLHLGYVSNEEFNSYLANSKYAMLNYQGEYSKRSSGVVYDTIFAGVPVIGCECLAFQFIAQEKLGYIYQTLDRLDLSIIKDRNLYDSYQAAICDYKKKNKQLIAKLHSFVALQ